MTEILPKIIRLKAAFMAANDDVAPTKIHVSEDINLRIKKSIEELKAMWPSCPAIPGKLHGMEVVQVGGTNVIEVH